MPRQTGRNIAHEIGQVRDLNPTWTHKKIAKYVGCTRSYVSQVLVPDFRPMYLSKMIKIYNIEVSREYYIWLQKEARTSNTQVEVIAQAMLNDAIAEAMEKECSK